MEIVRFFLHQLRNDGFGKMVNIANNAESVTPLKLAKTLLERESSSVKRKQIVEMLENAKTDQLFGIKLRQLGLPPHSQWNWTR